MLKTLNKLYHSNYKGFLFTVCNFSRNTWCLNSSRYISLSRVFFNFVYFVLILSIAFLILFWRSFSNFYMPERSKYTSYTSFLISRLAQSSANFPVPNHLLYKAKGADAAFPMVAPAAPATRDPDCFNNET